jgi:hypothetical protein
VLDGRLLRVAEAQRLQVGNESFHHMRSGGISIRRGGWTLYLLFAQVRTPAEFSTSSQPPVLNHQFSTSSQPPVVRPRPATIPRLSRCPSDMQKDLLLELVAVS